MVTLLTSTLNNNRFHNTKVDALFREIKAVFEQADLQTAGLDARLLFCHAAGISYEALIGDPNQTVQEHVLTRLEEYVHRRLNGEPVSRILGYREFWSSSFYLNEATLDPRPDTETLIETVIGYVDKNFNRETDLSILDLGTGSGCILITLLRELKNALGVGVDISARALEAARHNAVQLGVFNRVKLVQSNWLERVSGKFDIIISNPPYIPKEEISSLEPEVRIYDPSMALDGGKDGLDAYRVIIDQIACKITHPALIVFEIGAGQQEDVKTLLRSHQSGYFGHIEEKLDLNGHIRCIAAIYKK